MRREFLSCIKPAASRAQVFELVRFQAAALDVSDMNRRLFDERNFGGGGVLRMIHPGGEARGGLLSTVPDGGCVPAAFRPLEVARNGCAGAGFFVTNGAGRGSWPRVGRVQRGLCRRWPRIGPSRWCAYRFPGQSGPHRRIHSSDEESPALAQVGWGVKRATWRQPVVAIKDIGVQPPLRRPSICVNVRVDVGDVYDVRECREFRCGDIHFAYVFGAQ